MHARQWLNRAVWARLSGPHSIARRVQREIRLLRGQPAITRESGRLAPGSHPVTFVVVCGPGFDQAVPTAAATCRLGWCNGFEQLGIPYLLLSVQELARSLPELPSPICWIAGSYYSYLKSKNLTALR